MNPAEIIKKKRRGLNLSPEELTFMVHGYAKGELPDYQMSALLMAIFFKGMEPEETAHLTQIMIDSGQRVTFENSESVIDKHSTGGVGDKTSLILAPIAAACGVRVPMMSGRGLGHTGGTVDKLESIPGFKMNLSLDTFRKQVDHLGLAMISQTDAICPADKKIYGLRDVTATVESLPLICASILSKKIAEGVGGLVLDVKCGSGAFMKTMEEAKALADGLRSIGESHGLKVRTLITDMSQPLGAFVGNALEVAESIAILKGEPCLDVAPERFADCRELSLQLAAQMIHLAQPQLNEDEALLQATEALDSGRAWAKFEELCKIQGGDLSAIPLNGEQHLVLANDTGFVHAMNAEQVGLAAIELGAGRKVISDTIDPTSGLQIHKKIGEPVSSGDPLFTMYLGENKKQKLQAEQLLKNSVTVGSQKVSPKEIVLQKS